MEPSIRHGTQHIDWEELCKIFIRAPLGTRDPKRLQHASENSHTVVSAFVDGRLIGFGRAISDGEYQSAIYDVVVLPEFQKKGIGISIMNDLLDSLPKGTTILILSCNQTNTNI